MVSIVKRKIQEKVYYYLSYSYREGNKVKLIEKSLGKEIPSEDELIQLKEDLIRTIVKERWELTIEELKKGYSQKLREIPKFSKAERLKEFGIRFTYHSNKIEGSTLTLREVALAINEKEIRINKSVNDINEAQLHMLCYEDMIATKEDLTLDLVRKWHETLFSLHVNRSKLAGIIRKDPILISGSKHIPPISPQPLLDDLFEWYNNNKGRVYSVLLACFMHYRFEFIHPFNDGNGRMGRFIMNYILFKNKYPMFDINSKIRTSYYNALEKSDISNDEMFFVSWFFKNYIKSI